MRVLSLIERVLLEGQDSKADLIRMLRRLVGKLPSPVRLRLVGDDDPDVAPILAKLRKNLRSDLRLLDDSVIKLEAPVSPLVIFLFERLDTGDLYASPALPIDQIGNKPNFLLSSLNQKTIESIKSDIKRHLSAVEITRRRVFVELKKLNLPFLKIDEKLATVRMFMDSGLKLALEADWQVNEKKQTLDAERVRIEQITYAGASVFTEYVFNEDRQPNFEVPVKEAGSYFPRLRDRFQQSVEYLTNLAESGLKDISFSREPTGECLEYELDTHNSLNVCIRSAFYFRVSTSGWVRISDRWDWIENRIKQVPNAVISEVPSGYDFFDVHIDGHVLSPRLALEDPKAALVNSDTKKFIQGFLSFIQDLKEKF